MSDDLAGREIALYSEKCSEAELAIDSAAHLAGDANGRAFPITTGYLLRLVACLAAIASFAVVPLGHPNRLDTLRIDKPD